MAGIFGATRHARERDSRAVARRGRTLAVAESCTGGRIAAALTSVPGASQSFAAASLRTTTPSRSAARRRGARSRASARSAKRSRSRWRAARASGLDADVALATTGIAGPDGGTPEKPVGLVWFGLDDAGAARARGALLRGEREAILSRATTVALGILWQTLAS